MNILFSHEAILKLKYFTLGTKGEISGLGKSEFQEDNTIFISDIEIFKQKVSKSHTDLDEQAMAQFMNELMMKGESPVNWNVWWHTHADFAVFFSSTDVDTIAETGSPFLISLVVNRDLDLRTRLDIFKPFRFTFENKLQTIEHFKGRSEHLKNYCENKIKLCLEKENPKWWKQGKKKKWKHKSVRKGNYWQKDSNGKHKSSIQMKRKKPLPLLVQATSGDKQRGVWRKWGSAR